MNGRKEITMSFGALVVVCFFFCFIQDGGPQFAAILFFGYCGWQLVRLIIGSADGKKALDPMRKHELIFNYDFDDGLIKHLRKQGSYIEELKYMLGYEYLRQELIDYGLYTEIDEVKELREYFEKFAQETNQPYAEVVKYTFFMIRQFKTNMWLKQSMWITTEEMAKYLIAKYEDIAIEQDRTIDDVAAEDLWNKYGEKYFPRWNVDEEEIRRAFYENGEW